VYPIPLVLADIHPLSLQILPRLLYLLLDFLVRLRYVVECEDAPAELKEEVCAEGNQAPEGNLCHSVSCRSYSRHRERGARKTYDRHDLLLDRLGKADDFHINREVDLLRFSFQVYGGVCQGLLYGAQKHRDADSLLSTRHLGDLLLFQP
jgi:hypothetical protein